VAAAPPPAPDDDSTNALRAFDTAMLRDPRMAATILPVGDGLLVATWRG
jgi:predicted O-methyltransferase YrrM